VGKRCNNAISPCRVEFSIPGVEIVGQGPGIKLIAFPVCGLENKFPQGGKCRPGELNNNLHNISTLWPGK
jgi:hypothetical protein